MSLLVSASAAQAQQAESRQGIWAQRDTLVERNPGSPRVKIGVWDSGVDTALFAPRVSRNARGQVVLRGYDAFKRRQDTPMAILDAAILARRDELNATLIALDDLDGGVQSPQARSLAARLDSMTKEQSRRFDDEMGLWSGYAHGTGVADIALSSNEQAEIVIARMEWWHGSPPVPCWNRDLAAREADSIRDLLEFLVESGARVVNMSWGRAKASYLSNLNACAPGLPAEEKDRIAQFTIDTIRAVLRQGMARAPHVLFVGAAGNAGRSLSQADQATRFELPNFLLVGAVDRNGAAARYTNTGSQVTLFANGERVAARLPGGAMSYPSGTSMAAPSVSNAAAKMLAMNPRLSGSELRAMLEETAERSAAGLPLLHTRAAVAAARRRLR